MAQASTNPAFHGHFRDSVIAESKSPAYQAYQLLHWAFVIAPLIAGLDKFTQLLTHWDHYLAPVVARELPISARSFMLLVGVVEIIAAFIVAFWPKVGSVIVAIWLAAIISNLFLAGAYYDIALRDFGLFLGAIALSRLSLDFDKHVPRA